VTAIKHNINFQVKYFKFNSESKSYLEIRVQTIMSESPQPNNRKQTYVKNLYITVWFKFLTCCNLKKMISCRYDCRTRSKAETTL